MIGRVGAWVEPGTESDDDSANGAGAKKGARGSLISGLKGLWKSRSAPEPIEENVYVTEPCPIDDALLDELATTIRNAQAQGVDHAWRADWAALAAHRRKADKARADGRSRDALVELCEAIDLLGLAAGINKKERGPIGAA